MAYSAMKIIANFTEPYSILKPETNSDSPSAKSKGVRFNSARIVITHRNKTKKFNKPKGVSLAGATREKNSNLNLGKRREIKIKAKLIS